eukprot:14289101-Alexandrium_andersonii.AAC.1
MAAGRQTGNAPDPVLVRKRPRRRWVAACGDGTPEAFVKLMQLWKDLEAVDGLGSAVGREPVVAAKGSRPRPRQGLALKVREPLPPVAAHRPHLGKAPERGVHDPSPLFPCKPVRRPVGDVRQPQRHNCAVVPLCLQEGPASQGLQRQRG